jgi:hypothetical protein
MMKRVLATGFAAVAAALALGMAQPAQAQTRCRWVGRQMQCQDARINNNYNNYDYYNQNRNNRYHNDQGYYEDWRRQNRSYHNDHGYYEDWRRDQWRNNNNYYTNRNYANNGDLRSAINEIYRRELGRNADWQGIQHYSNQYYRGWSLGQIRNDIANSNEARNRYYYR